MGGLAMKGRDKAVEIDEYQYWTRRESELREAANQAASQRARTVALMHASGSSYGRIAQIIGLSRSAVQKLVERGRAADSVADV